MNSNNIVVIAAISSRLYVQAAVDAGFEVIAIDAFADVDTQKLAIKNIQIDIVDGQFHHQQLLAVLNQIDVNSCIGFCYGAGFEAQPALLAEIANLLPVIGNNAAAVNKCKQPQQFFALCDTLKIAYPETVFEKPNSTLSWLQKTTGASGGIHIKPVLPLNIEATQQVYYQKIQAGTPISCLFLADGKQGQVLGFNEQWCSPTVTAPYRFGGAVSHASVSDIAQHKLEAFVQAATAEWGLKGLNSCDVIVQNDAVFVLEINPRLSASLGLYVAKRGNLFAAHVASSQGLLVQWPTVEKQSRALQIIYANQTAKVPPEMDWPDWVCDIPQPNSVIPAGMPICSVMVEARTAKLAKKKVLERAASL